MQDLILAKIGGSSLKGPKGFKRCLGVLNNTPSIGAIVISATFNTTNLLEQLANKSLKRDFAGVVATLKELKDKHLDLARDLDLKLNTSIEELVLKAQSYSLTLIRNEKRCPEIMDSLYSIGELLSANLFSAFLEKSFPEKKIHFFDAREVIITDSNFGKATPLYGEIEKHVDKVLKPLLNKNSYVVIPGFIGKDLKEKTTTLGREGSDLSAALLASALNVGELHIYKDVAGIYSADPKLVESARQIKQMDFNSINTLSEYGAKVLFPKALIPVMEKDIKVFIGSNLEPNLGTEIIKEDTTIPICGITLRSSYMRIDLERIDSSTSPQNFIDNVLHILAEKNITPENIFYPKGLVSFIISSKADFPEEIRNHLREFCQVSQENRVSLVTIVGKNLDKGNLSIAVQTLLEEKISLGKVSKGSNFITYAFPSRFEKKVLNHLHHNLFS